jgi:GT2 family glycosyltransferase
VSAKVDLLVVLHNNRDQLGSLFTGLRRITIPLTAYFLDNNSRDGTADAVVEAIGDLPFTAYLLRSLRNNGFARGVNLLARQGSAEFMFLLNPDTEIQAGCLETLLARVQTDCKVAICEARQFPREHPKPADSNTGETTWCSGAAALIRREAFDEVGGFDELYFMYCEDVDLSWKFWLKGWKCVYARDAVVHHYTQDLVPDKRRTIENYLSFRNSIFLFYRFGSWSERGVLWRFLSNRFVSPAYSAKSKLLFGIAFIDHIRYIPYLLQSRHSWSGRKHRWVRFEATSLSR